MISSARFLFALLIVGISFGFQGIENPGIAAPPLYSKFRDTSAIHLNKRITDIPRSSAYRLVIRKSAYEMTLFDQEGWYGTYPVVFGNKNQEDKRMEGDRLTPEGHFRIVGKKIHKTWGKFLMLDYPTKESYERFETRKAKGVIPKKASIGGGIGIHGTRPNEEWVIDKFINWTAGCISVRYSDMDELYEMLPIGTEVIIEK